LGAQNKTVVYIDLRVQTLTGRNSTDEFRHCTRQKLTHLLT